MRSHNASSMTHGLLMSGRTRLIFTQWHDDRNIQTLTGVEIHCRACDEVSHIGRRGVGGGSAVVIPALGHLADVNGWTRQQAMQHYNEATAVLTARSARRWAQDTSWFGRWAEEHDAG